MTDIPKNYPVSQKGVELPPSLYDPNTGNKKPDRFNGSTAIKNLSGSVKTAAKAARSNSQDQGGCEREV